MEPSYGNAQHTDITRMPNIILNIPTQPYVSSLLPPSTPPTNTTDIVPFLQAPLVQLKTILKHQLNYPDHFTFCLEGYNGKVDSDKLASNITTVASKNGTSLKIDVNDQCKARPNN